MKTGGEDEIRARIVNPEDFVGDDKRPGPRDEKLAREPENDTGNGKRLRTLYGRDLMHVPEIGRFAWTGSRWSNRDGDKQWAIAAHKTAAHMLRFQRGALEAYLAENGTDDGGKRLRGFTEWCIASGNLARLLAMQTVSEPYLQHRVDELDAQPFLFNVQNGVMELGSKSDPVAVRLRRHSRLDLITRIAPVGYDKDATCYKFREFLEQIIPDREVQLWLQRWFGYCLTASFQDRVFACFWGEGANGKSVLTKLFRWLYGDYAATLQFASLLDDTQRRGSEATPDLAKLPGVRAVFAGEPKKGARLDDGLIKQVTGGDEINVRKLHHDFFDLQPTFKVTLAFNNKPIVRDDSQGMWSRVMLVPFQATIPESRQDKSLLDKLKAEGPGVLNWALDGFRMWREQGLAPPEAILGASAEWRSESDQIGLFLEMATVRDPAEKVSAGALFACYEDWARAMEVRPVSQTLFGRQLT